LLNFILTRRELMFLNYNYYFGMTPEEQLLDDERTSKNRKQIKKVLLTAGWFIIFSTAVPKSTDAAPLPGAEGFSISSPQPKKYGRLPIRHSNHPRHQVIQFFLALRR